MDRIARVDVWQARFLIDRPMQLGAIMVRERDFVAVRVLTDDGIHGSVYSLSRGLPVDVVIADTLAPALIGREFADARTLATSMGAIEPNDTVRRARGLIDLCLWDIQAKAAGVPIAECLGAAQGRPKVMRVARQPEPGEVDADYADSLARTLRGADLVKVYVPEGPRASSRFLGTIRAAIGPDVGLVVDVAWAWSRADDALALVSEWAAFDLSWIEDPFPIGDIESLARLTARSTTPIASGDEVTDSRLLIRLAQSRSVQRLRADVTLLGIDGFRAVVEAAVEAGIAVSPHAYPEIHRHLVYGLEGVTPLEAFASDHQAWPVSLFARQVEATVDIAARPLAPGLGLELDVAVLERHALRSHHVGR
jgi:L-alanine-DL-glutamate epimerase-like enolase superfamily enzyme